MPDSYLFGYVAQEKGHSKVILQEAHKEGCGKTSWLEEEYILEELGQVCFSLTDKISAKTSGGGNSSVWQCNLLPTTKREDRIKAFFLWKLHPGLSFS